MASITLKNIPEDLLRSLREAARRDRRSLNQETFYLLTSAMQEPLKKPVFRAPEVEAQVAAWRELAGKWESDLDFETEVEQLAKSRTMGRRVDFGKPENP